MIFIPQSLTTAPNGQVIAGTMGKTEGLLFADIDLSQIIAAKRMLVIAGHYSRPHVFTFKVNKIL